MKIYEYIRGENERTIKLFGFTFMSQTSDYMTAERLQKFLGGIITTTKVNDQVTDCSRKDIQIFGYSIAKRIEENNYRIYYMFGKEVRRISLIDQFKKQYFKYFNKQHDDIYLLRANSGEIYLTLTYLIDALIKRNQSKKPLLVATHKYHIDMIRMLCPDLPYHDVTIDFFEIHNIKKRCEEYEKLKYLNHHYTRTELNDDRII